MRWSSWLAAALLAAGIVLALQSGAEAGGKHRPPRDLAGSGWQAQTVRDDGAPAEISRKSFDTLRAKLAPDDPVAVLEAVGFALAEVGDGATYVWHRTDGPLMGNVHMASSFRDEAGSICRRLTVTLVLGEMVQPAHLTACRGDDGQWVLGR